MTQAWQLGNLTLNTASVPYTTTSIVAATRPAITAITLAHYQCCGAFMNLSMGAIKHMYAYKKYICIHTHTPLPSFAPSLMTGIYSLVSLHV